MLEEEIDHNITREERRDAYQELEIIPAHEWMIPLKSKNGCKTVE